MWNRGNSKRIAKQMLGLVFLGLLICGFIVASISAPYVMELDPFEPTSKVTFNAPFTIHFSHHMQPASVEKAFSISPHIEGKFKWKDRKTLEFYPKKTLTIGDSYHILIKDSAKSFWLKTLEATTSIDYLVTGPPYVLYAHPEDGKRLQAGDVITVMFDRPMAFSDHPKSELIQMEPPLEGDIRILGLSAFQFIPKITSSFQETTITIPAGLVATDGGETETDYTFTLKKPDLRVIQTQPAPEAINVGIESPLIIHFNQAVDLNEIKPGTNALLYPSNDLEMEDSLKQDGFFNTEVTYQTDKAGNKVDQVLVFTPTFPYQYDMEYRFVLKAETGLALEDDFELIFKTVSDPDKKEEEIAEISQEEDDQLAWADTASFRFFMAGEYPRFELREPLKNTTELSICQIPSNQFIRVQASQGWKEFQCEKEGIHLNPNKRSNKVELNLNDYSARDWIPGVYFVSLETEEKKIWKVFFIEDAALLLKRSEEDLLVWALDIKTGQPLADMSIEVLRFDGTLILQGRTDTQGLYLLNDPLEEGVYVRGKKEGSDRDYFSLVSDQWQLSDADEVTASPALNQLYVFTDQNTYLPGDTIQLKGIWRIEENHLLTFPDHKQVMVTLEDDAHNLLIDTRIALRRNGSFDSTISLPSNVADGNYTLTVADLNYQQLTSPLPLQIQNKTPEIELSWLEAKKNHSAYKAPVYLIQARFQNGLPASNIRGHYTLYKKYFKKDYQKGAVRFYFENEAQSCQKDCFSETLVNEGDVLFDEEGVTRLILTESEENFLSAGYEYDLIVTVPSSHYDVSHLRTSFQVHQGDFDLGLGLKHALVPLGNPLELEVVALDFQDYPLEDQRITLSLLSKDNSPKPLYEKSLTTYKNTTPFSIPTNTLTTEGFYLLRAEAIDLEKNHLRVEHPIYIYSEDTALSSELSIVADQSRYFVGGRAHLAISEPRASEDHPILILITYERNGLLGHEIMELRSPFTEVLLPIEETMMPHFLVKVTRFQKGIPSHFDWAAVPIDVENDESSIFTEITLDPEKPKPGDEVLVTFHTYDFQKRPIPAVIALNILKNEVSLWDGFSSQFFHEKKPVPLTSASSISIRSPANPTISVPSFYSLFNEPDSLFFDPLITTGENGKGEVRFTLPKNVNKITLWGTVTKDKDQFGQIEASFDLDQTLLVRPILPSFVLPEDQTIFGAMIKNVSENEVSTHLSLHSPGIALRGDATRNISLKPGQQTEITFNTFIDPSFDAEILPLQFDSSEEENLLQVNLPIIRLPEQTDLVTGEMISEIWTGRFTLLKEAYPGLGFLEIYFGASPLILADLFTTALDHYQNHSNYLLASRLLAHLSQNSEEVIIKGLLSHLLHQSQPNGGYAYFQGGKTDPFVTAHIAFAYKEAIQKGFEIDENTLNQMIRYLLSALELKENSLSLDETYFILWSLGLYDSFDTEKTLALYKKRDEAGVSGQVFLLMNLDQLIQAGQRSISPFFDRLKSELLDQVSMHETMASFADSPYETAIALYGLSTLDADLPILSTLVNFLFSRPTELLHPLDPSAALWIILALPKYEMGHSSESESVNYITQVKVNGELLVDQSVTSQSLTEVFEVSLPAKDLTGQAFNDLFVKKEGEGPLYFDAHLYEYLDPMLLPRVEDGFVIVRNYFEINEDGIFKPVKSFKKGGHYMSRLEVIVPKDTPFVSLKEPVPAGFKALEASDDSTAFSAIYYEPEAVTYYSSLLPAGVYQIDTLLEATLPGSYHHLPAQVESFSVSSEWGRTESTTLQVTE